jgi:hypothetical protein
MRAVRTTRFVAVTLALTLGTSVATVTANQSEEPLSVRGVVGAVELDPPASLGGFTAIEGIHQHRDIPVTGSQIITDDLRLRGPLHASMNYDVQSSGQEPVPAWGTISIDEGAWTGTFTGIRDRDFEPFAVRAFLVGNGSFEGLCAVLDIAATDESWAIDGVIHPLPMGA